MLCEMYKEPSQSMVLICHSARRSLFSKETQRIVRSKKEGSLSKMRGLIIRRRSINILNEEYKLKKEQREDISQSVSSLESFIADLEQQCIARFSETYQHVNAHFQEMYPHW